MTCILDWETKHVEEIIGYTIRQVVVDDSGEFYGFRCDCPGKPTMDVFIMRDEEGNGPGALYLQPVEG